MINFRCTCGHALSVPEDQSGTALQCPACKKLCDVPTLDDLASLAPDGTYVLDAPEPHKSHLPELTRVFSPAKVDADGNEKDLRTSIDDLMAAGGDEVPLELAGELRPGAPRYDPETGELIRPMPVTPPAPPPPPAPPELQYASPFDAKTARAGPALLAFFQPINLVVMTFMLLPTFLLTMLLIALAMARFAMALVPMIAIAILAHFSNVIDESGRAASNELPRPLRDAAIFEDVLMPALQFAIALTLCYAPAGVMMFNRWPPGPWTWWIGPIAAALAGSIFFPAVLLTTTTSGTILNLRPDRVLKLMFRLGWRYPALVGLWFVAACAYAQAIIGSLVINWSLFVCGGKPAVDLVVACGMVIAGTIAIHFFCYVIGLMYRWHQPKFPWTLQRHERTRTGAAAMSPAARRTLLGWGRDRRARAAAPVVPQPVLPVETPPPGKQGHRVNKRP